MFSDAVAACVLLTEISFVCAALVMFIKGKTQSHLFNPAQHSSSGM